MVNNVHYFMLDSRSISKFVTTQLLKGIVTACSLNPDGLGSRRIGISGCSVNLTTFDHKTCSIINPTRNYEPVV